MLAHKILIAAVGIAAASGTSHLYAASADESLGLASMTRINTQRIAVQQAIVILTSEASDSDGDGYIETPAMLAGVGAPTGGGFVPAASAAPKSDSYGTQLGYCAFDNGSTNASAGRITGIVLGYSAPVASVISSGADNIFQTSCANIAAGLNAQGDDYAIVYNSTQIQMGNSGTLFYGDPVADTTALNALAAASLKDGQIRVVKDTNKLFKWNAATTAWIPVGSGGSDGSTQNYAPFGSAAAPGYSFLGATNTGMYMPAANKLALSVNGTTSLIIDRDRQNVGIGQPTMSNLASYRNVGIGYGDFAGTLGALTSGDRNIALGGSLIALTTGTNNIGIGTSLLSVTSGSRNVAIGAGAMTFGTGSENVAVGTEALRGSHGTRNVALGMNAMRLANANNNIAIGYESLNLVYTDHNIALGHLALRNAGSGQFNVAIGYFGSDAVTSGSNNTSMGGLAGGGIQTGSLNTSFGWASGTSNNKSGAEQSTFIGANAKIEDTTAMAGSGFITLIGSDTRARSLASSNYFAFMTAVGAQANVTTINSLVLGRASTYNGAGLPSGDKTIIGATGDSGAAAILQVNGASQHRGLAVDPAGSEGMFYYNSTSKAYRYHDGIAWNGMFPAPAPVSISALANSISDNTLSNAAFSQAWGWQLTGNTAAFSITESAASTSGTGSQYLQTISTLAGSTAIPLRVVTRGVEAFRVDSTNPQIVANIGTVTAPAYSFSANQTSGFYMASGELSASVSGVRTLVAGFGVTGLGRNVLASNVNASATAMGGGAMFSNTNGARNSAFGNSALSLNTTGSSNTAIGYFSQKNGSGSANTSVGENSLSATGTGGNNVAIGSYALALNSSGNGNVGVGAEVLNITRATTGSNNTLVGFASSFGDTIAMAASGNITLLGASTRALSLGSAQANAYMTAVGASANVTTINSLVLGRASTYTAGLPSGDKVIIGATGDSGAAAILQINGASQHRGLASAPTGSEGMQYYDSTLKEYRYHNGTAWGSFVTPQSTIAISKLTAASATNTINNAAFAQTWNWQLTGDSSAFSITESAASTGGTGTQYLQTISTLAGSTATPLRVVTRGVEAFRVDATNPQIVANVGSVSAPSYSFNGSQNSGLYMSAGDLSASVSGVRNLVTGAGVTGFGRNALAVNTSSSATAVGENALISNTTGTRNVAIGTDALSLNTIGASNTAMGHFALKSSVGSGNTALGESALLANGSGSNNIAIGWNSLSSNSTGSGNVVMGANGLSIVEAVTGGNNTVVGNAASFEDTSSMAGSSNITLLGANARATSLVTPQDAYMTAVGAGSTVTSINTLILGRATDNVAIGQTSSGPQQFYVNGTAGGTSGYAVSSDARFKMNVELLSAAMSRIQKMQGVSYEFNHRAFPSRKFEAGRQLGFIAQQIEAIAPEVVRTDNEGFKSVQYSQLVPLLVEGMKEQQSVLQYLTRKNDVTLALNINTLEGTQAHFKRVEADAIKVKDIEAETARIGKLTAREIDSPKIESQLVRSDVFKTGEIEANLALGAFQPIFEVRAGMQFIVNATAEDGSAVLVSVSMTGGSVAVSPISGKGIDVMAIGSQIGVTAANKRVKVSWIRMS